MIHGYPCRTCDGTGAKPAWAYQLGAVYDERPPQPQSFTCDELARCARPGSGECQPPGPVEFGGCPDGRCAFDGKPAWVWPLDDAEPTPVARTSSEWAERVEIERDDQRADVAREHAGGE